MIISVFYVLSFQLPFPLAGNGVQNSCPVITTSLICLVCPIPPILSLPPYWSPLPTFPLPWSYCQCSSSLCDSPNFKTQILCWLEALYHSYIVYLVMCFSWCPMALRKCCVPGWIPGCVVLISTEKTLHCYCGWRFCLDKAASGSSDPSDLVSVSPATNEGVVIMHERRLHLSMFWLLAGRRHQPVTKPDTFGFSVRLLFSHINFRISSACVSVSMML